MKNLRLLLLVSLCLAFFCNCYAQVAQLSITGQRVKIDSAAFYVLRVKDKRKDTTTIGNAFSAVLNKYIPIQFLKSADTTIGEMLGNLTTADSTLLPVIVNIEKLEIAEDTINHNTKNCAVNIILSFDRELDGELQQCYSATGGDKRVFSIRMEPSAIYSGLIIRVIQAQLQFFNTQILNKTINTSPVTKIKQLIFQPLTPQGPDTIVWSPGRKLLAADFLGTVPHAEQKTDVLSASAPGFIATAYTSNDTGGRTITIKTAALFFKKTSWIKQAGKKEAKDLLFEQMKFDLARLYEEKFKAALYNSPLTASGFATQFNNVYDSIELEYKNETKQMSNDCADALRSATIFKKSKFTEWKEKIEAELKAALNKANQ